MTSKRTSVKDRYPEAHRERTAETSGTSRQVLSRLVVALLGVALPAAIACAQGEPSEPKTRAEESRAQQKPSELETTQDYNRRLDELRQILAPHLPASGTEDHIGAEDLVEVTVFEAPEMNRVARVSSRGEISVPLLGAVHCAGLAPHELEIVLEELLRRSY